jgi:GH35 family endo-1,4-beta-xylanase
MPTSHTSDSEILDGAQQRILEHRTAEVELRLISPKGFALAGAEAAVRLTRHGFRLGANAFNCCGLDDPGLAQAYRDRFSELLNFATLPFYWGGYEPQPGKPQEERLDAMATWCAEHRICVKGHPLAWHEVFPAWAGQLDDAEVIKRLQARVRALVKRFADRIQLWDVVNEATVSHRFDNAVGRWIAAQGAASAVAQALCWAREANPGATLLYNDFNICEDFEKLVAALLAAKAPVDVLGIQSHMHQQRWTLARAWDVCETYGRFGLPLHFTELTVLSGRLKDPDDKDWHRVHTDWHSTPEGEAEQAEYGQALFTLLFSHPAVRAITWWDFSDAKAWQGAPAGLVRNDMSPKPLYERLLELFTRRWVTRSSAVTDSTGSSRHRCYFGEHKVEARLPSGDVVTGEFDLVPAGPRLLEVTVR